MRALHNSLNSEFRKPFGAVPVNTQVRLCLYVWDDPDATAELRCWIDGVGESLYPMQRVVEDDHLRFSVDVSWDTTQIVWYYFNITSSEGDVWRYGARAEDTPGEGAFAYGEPPSFQITVYENVRKTYPKWYTEGVVYQIFPDRFNRSAASKERALTLFSKEEKEGRRGPKRRFVDDWNKVPSYEKDKDGRVVAWDFYGGDLDGICEKLDYIQGLGATILYLNPIFTAASNHRYDTANYLEVDPLLGGDEAFLRLVAELKKRNMHLILDGVFNHVGSDSPYFNRYGNYPNKGAYQGGSKYDSWFTKLEDGSFESWWGIDDLPATNEDAADFKTLILGKDGVVAHWLELGADGWRLDVADELSDEFIAEIKSRALATKANSLLLGEVWEDASHKQAYGKLRKYFQGRELDGVMNYPMRDAFMNFILQKASATQVSERLCALFNNYPKEALYSSLNLMGSHDRERLLWQLAEADPDHRLSEEEKLNFKPDAGHMDLAVSRLWVVTLLQMLMPGVPSIYYGDEAGLGGFADPQNRGPFPWSAINPDTFAIYRNALALRRSISTFTDGKASAFAPCEDVLCITRYDENNKLFVLANASLAHSHTIEIPLSEEEKEAIATGKLVVDDIVGGKHLKLSEDGKLKSFLSPLGTSVIYIREQGGLAKELPAGAGVLEHITSLASTDADSAGKLGAAAKDFIDQLAATGASYWQILPLNPTDAFGSPYAGLSAFAGNTQLLSKAALEDVGKAKLHSKELVAFRKENEHWLEDYASFAAIKDVLGTDKAWVSWPEKYRTYSPVIAKDPDLREARDKHIAYQYIFDKVWNEIHDYARAKGIHIIGDMPMYVSYDSADVWAHPELFDLDAQGRAKSQAGAPPDNFAKDGQAWGNPCYVWDVHKRSGYSWWLDRLSRAFDLYDYVRLDHFLGFSSYFKILAGEPAVKGAWQPGPGMDLFRAAYKKLGPLPIIAEDLGLITPAVRALLAESGANGMDVIQFSDQDPKDGWAPKCGTIAYSSTHDTQTIYGFVDSRYQGMSDAEKEQLAKNFMDKVLNSQAPVRIVSLQDLLLLPDSERMNVPGTAEGNWSWKATVEGQAKGLKILAAYLQKEL